MTSVGAPFSLGQLDLIEHQEVAGAAVTTVTFSSLVGDSDYWYLLLYRIVNPNAPSVSIDLRPNNVATNQDYVRMSWDGSGGGHGTAGNQNIGIVGDSSNASLVAVGEILFCAATGLERGGVGQWFRPIGTAGLTGFISSTIWNETSTKITSLVVNGDVAASIGIGSTLTLYRVQT
jgi:hypothetical protein